MSITFHRGIGDAVIFRALVAHDTEQVTCGEEMNSSFRDVILSDKLFIIGAHQALIGVAAVEVTAHFQSESRRFCRGPGHVMPGMKIPDGPAVGDDMAFKVPFAAECIAQEHLAATAGLAVGAVIGTHNGFDFCFGHQILKGGKISLLQILGGGDSVELMAECLRTAVYGKVLGARGAFQMLSIALQAMDISLAKPGCEVGVLAVGLVSAAPARIAEDVDVWRPEAQTVIDVPISLLGELIELGAAFS